MYCSSIFVLVLLANLALPGATFQRNRILTDNNGPPYSGGLDVLNIGNGVGRDNKVVLGSGGYARSQPGPNYLGNRFGEESQTNDRRTAYLDTINNIGNGIGNRNTVVLTDGQHGTVYSQMNTNRGTTFTTRNRNEASIYNVGYGKDNHNVITHYGKPVVPQYTDSRGSMYNIQRANGETESIYVVNTGAQQTSEVTRIMKSLHGLASQLQHIIAKLIEEAAKLNL